MNRFLAFLRKEFYHIFRDPRTLVILFGIPIAQLMLFGYVLTNEVRNVKIAIVDHSKDDLSKRLSQRLLSSGFFQLAAIPSSESEYEDLFRSSKVKEIVVFNPDFAKNLMKEGKADLQVIADASEPNTAQLVVNYTTAITNDFVRSEFLKDQSPPGVNIKVRMLFNENMRDAYNFIPGLIAVILMLVSAMMTAITITREKENGTMEILLASPLKPIQIILGKVTPYLILSIINALVVLLLGYFVFEVPVIGSVALLLGEILLFIFLALSLGILISTFVNNQVTALALSGFVLMLPSILLSGFIFPVKNMPVPLQIVANLMPPRWFIEINRTVMLKGGGLDIIWPHTLVLLGMAILFIFISIRKFKIRLQ
ncbi:MAG: ABC transporter permease [Mariniphaga sp.]